MKYEGEKVPNTISIAFRNYKSRGIGKRETINMNRRKRKVYHAIDMILKLVLHFININVYMYSIFYLKQVYLG